MALSTRQLKFANRRRVQLVEICEMLPEVLAEAKGIKQQHVAFKVRKKTFAYYLFDHHDDGRIAFCCKSTIQEQQRLLSMEPDQYYVPPYLGVKGWVAIRLDTTKPNWGVIVRLARDAFIAVAPKKLAEGVD